MRTLRPILLLMLLGLLALPTLAQTSTPLTADEPLDVNLRAGEPVVLTYTLDSAQTVTLTARALGEPPLDTTLEVLNIMNVRLAFNDDHGSDRDDLAATDSLIEALELRAGTYTIRVNSFSGAETGRVEVLLSTGAATPKPAGRAGGSFDLDGTIPVNDRFRHTFQAVAGDVLDITVRATDGSLDPIARLLDSDGRQLAENDDHDSSDLSLGRYDSRIENFSVPAGGPLTVEITGFAGSGGAFTLTIDWNEGGTQPFIETPIEPGAVETITGDVGQGYTFTHLMTAQAGDVYTFTLRATSSEFDPDLAIYTGSELVANNYEHGTSDRTLDFFDARINNLIIPTTGTYTIEVSGYEAGTLDRVFGTFELRIERTATGAPLGPGTEAVFTGEVETFGTFSQGFDAQQGDYVTIAVRALSENFDPVTRLRSPNEALLADNDDHGTVLASLAQFDSLIQNVRIPADGRYVVEVEDYNESAGSFAITVTTRR